MGAALSCLRAKESTQFPPLHVQEPVAEHRQTVILLHGRGCTASEFAKVLSGMSTSSGLNLFEHFPNVKWVFPSAPLNRGISQWFHIPSPLRHTSLKQHVPVSGLETSVKYVEGVVQDEIRRLGSASKVVLGGVSQGQATALHVFLRGGHRLGAFVGASGWLPLANKIDAVLNLGDVLETPVFLGHGTFDSVVDVERGRQARDLLNKMKMKHVVWKEYVGADLDGHWLKEPEELDDIVEFLKVNFQ